IFNAICFIFKIIRRPQCRDCIFASRFSREKPPPSPIAHQFFPIQNLFQNFSPPRPNRLMVVNILPAPNDG
ncbi:MAG: hypothetical protein K6A67_04670, partial [Bacteroidales bacterium]|nr:hypothetical protein [Bacteroidales bacterium]